MHECVHVCVCVWGDFCVLLNWWPLLFTWSVTGVYFKMLRLPFTLKRSLPTSRVSPELLNFQRNVLQNTHTHMIYLYLCISVCVCVCESFCCCFSLHCVDILTVTLSVGQACGRQNHQDRAKGGSWHAWHEQQQGQGWQERGGGAGRQTASATCLQSFTFLK